MKITLLIITAGMAALSSSCSLTSSSGTTGTVPAPVVAELSKIPVGRPDPAGRKNLVISPYRPYNLIDVTGYKKGAIAGDPSTAQKDPKTGKIIESTSKYFRIP
jgi:hypothetical protein